MFVGSTSTVHQLRNICINRINVAHTIGFDKAIAPHINVSTDLTFKALKALNKPHSNDIRYKKSVNPKNNFRQNPAVKNDR